jgi:hypothetical protein
MYFLLFTVPVFIIVLNLSALRKVTFLAVLVSLATIAAAVWSGCLLREKYFRKKKDLS